MSGRTLYDIFEGDGGEGPRRAKGGHTHGILSAVPVSTTLPKELVERIDTAARERKISRLAMVRQLVVAGAGALDLP
jgi:hypothetical protein